MRFALISSLARGAATSISALLLACSGDDGTRVDTGAAPALDEAQAAELDDYLREALQRYQVPGVAVAVVRGTDVVYEGTFGVRGLEDPRPVTAQTLFAMASVTKSMTSLMAATLVDDAQLDWNTLAMDILPEFWLSDPTSTPRIRFRDLLNGTSGVPRFDTPFFVHTFEPTELVRFVRAIPTTAPPGEVFGYSNAMVSLGGYIAAAAAGAPYEDASLRATYVRLMQERVLSPIGMHDTTFDIDAALGSDDHAWPHSYDSSRGAISQSPIASDSFTGSVTPAGGAWSNLRDMAAYASAQLSGVAPNGTRLVSPENLEATHAEAIARLPEGELPTVGREETGYAMGWFTTPDYLGQRALSHDGNTLGFTSEVLLLPDADLAVVVLANRAMANAFYGAVEQFAVETTLGLEHAGDALQAADNEQLLGLLESLGEDAAPVAEAQAAPYVGEYEYGARVDYAAGALTLSTDFGPVSLQAYPGSDLFVRTGVLTGMTLAAFDSASAPTQLTLGILGGEGLSQPFVLQRVGE